MINALVSCVPPILSSTVFLALFIFLGAVLGVQFFSGTRKSIEGHATNVPPQPQVFVHGATLTVRCCRCARGLWHTSAEQLQHMLAGDHPTDSCHHRRKLGDDHARLCN